MAFKKGNIYTDANKTNGIYPNTVFSAVYTDDMSTTLGNIASYNATNVATGAGSIELPDIMFTITEDDTGTALDTPITFKIVKMS